MFEQAVLPDTQTPLPLQVEADQAAVFQDVASWRRTRFLWTGLGFAVVTLIGLLLHASRDPSRLVPERAAFNFLARHPGHARPANAPGSRAAVLAVGREPLASSLAKIPSRSQRSSPVMSAGGAILERQRVPPAPPSPPPPGEGGDGSGEPNEFFLRRIPGPEAMELLDGWIARTRVYCLSAQFGDEAVAEEHRKSLADLEALRSSIVTKSTTVLHPVTKATATTVLRSSIVTKATAVRNKDTSDVMVEHKQPVLFALYSSDKMTVLAIAACSSHRQYLVFESKAHSLGIPSLVVAYVSVCPPELDDDSSTAALKIRQGLRLMANVLGHELVLPHWQDVDPE